MREVEPKVPEDRRDRDLHGIESVWIVVGSLVSVQRIARMK